jgi:exonuclease SbcC
MKEIINERPETRLDILRHIFGIDRYRRIKENAQILLQKIKESVKIKESQIREINNIREKLAKTDEDRIRISKEVSELVFSLERVNFEKKSFTTKLDELRNILDEKARLDVQLSKIEGELQGKKSIKIRLERDISTEKIQLSDKIDFRQEELENVTALLIKHKKLLDEFNSRFMEVNSRVYSYNSQKETALKMKEKVVSMENCPTCFQSVLEGHKDKISKKTQFEIEDIERDLEQKIVEKTQILRDMEKEKILINGYEQDKTLLEKNKIRFEHQRIAETKIKSDYMILDRTICEIESSDKQIFELRNKIESFKQTKEIFDSEKKKFDNMDFESRRTEISLAEKRKEFEMLINRSEELGKEIAEKEKIRAQMILIRSFQDWLEEKFITLVSMTENNVMLTLRRDFSRTFNEWFTMLVSDALSVRIDEDFTPIILNQDYEIDYEFLSGGERTAVALAYRLALNQITNSLISKLKTKDLLILDEPTDGFSEAQLDKMRDIFEQLEAKQIILVSHEQKIEGFVDNIIRIKKEGTSKIESVKG